MMINPTITLPTEIWNFILDNCSDLNAIISTSKVNKQIRELALEKLENIKININKLSTELYKIQDLYSIRYQNINGPHIDIARLGKLILLEISIQDGLVDCGQLRIIDSDLMGLEHNQIIITPNFGNKEFGKFLPENNPNYTPFGIGLDSQAYSIAQDKLPVKKITIKSKLSNPHVLIAIKLATNRVNSQFNKLNGSFADFFTNMYL